MWWPYFVDEMLRHHFPQARVELLPMLVEHHGVSVPVQLLKAQPTVVLPLDLLDGVLQKVPDVVDILLVHGHLPQGPEAERREKQKHKNKRLLRNRSNCLQYFRPR